MFILKTRDNKTVFRRDGEPFVYSNETLARIGKRVLELERKETLFLRKA